MKNLIGNHQETTALQFRRVRRDRWERPALILLFLLFALSAVGQKAPKTVSTITELTTLPPATLAANYVGTGSTFTGTVIVSDPLRGGTFRWVTSGTNTVDNGLVFSASGGQWERIWNGGPVDAQWYGAVSDDSTDSVSAINAAISASAARGGGVVYLPGGARKYQIGSPIILRHNVILVGDGKTFTDRGSATFGNPEYKAGHTTSVRLMAGSNCGWIEFDTNGAPARVASVLTPDGVTVTKRAANSGISGIAFEGNAANQTNNAAAGIRLHYLWNFDIKDCSFFDWRGNALMARDCNVVNMQHCDWTGNLSSSKGCVFYTTTDGYWQDNNIGGVLGPSLILCDTKTSGDSGNWVMNWVGNKFYNNIMCRAYVTNLVGNELQFSTNHLFGTGSPVLLSADPGGIIPIGFTNSYVAWAIRISTNTIKLSHSYEGALASNVMAISGGTPPYYAHAGMGSCLHLTGGARDNAFVGNRFDQSEEAGVSLSSVFGNSFVGNIISLNGYNTLTGLGNTNNSYGVFMEAGSVGNSFIGNIFSRNGVTQPQKIGIFADDSCYSNVLGPNVYGYTDNSATKTNIVSGENNQVPMMINFGPTNHVDNLDVGLTNAVTPVLKITGGASGSPIMRLNRQQGSAGDGIVDLVVSEGSLIIRDSSTNVFVPLSIARLGQLDGLSTLTLGGALNYGAFVPSGTLIEGYGLNGFTNTAGGVLGLSGGLGNGNSVRAVPLEFYTPVAAASGTTAQSRRSVGHVTSSGLWVFGTNTMTTSAVKIIGGVSGGDMFTLERQGISTNYFSQMVGGTRLVDAGAVATTASWTLDASGRRRHSYGTAGTDPSDWAGSGSPEGVITDVVGSTYRRTDGGAGTTFYVKESGTGNTGWVGK